MRPPMQAPALQPQHELIHHQQQQHQHQHQHQLQHQQQQQQRQHQQLQQRQLQHHQHQETAAAAAAAANLANHQQRKSKQPRDRGPLVDSQLTFVGSPWSTTATKAKTTELAATFVTSQKQRQKQQQQQSQQLQQQQQHRQYQRRLPSSYADHDRHHDHHHDHDHDHDDGDSIQLLDLSNSPAHAHSHPAPFHAAAYQQRRAVAPSAARTRSNSLSFSDCGFSRSSSSEDGSYAACDHLRLFSPGGAGRASTATGTAAGCSDDPGENFVIHFPAGDIDTDVDVDPDVDLNDANGDVLQLPLSETEPLLTHIGTSGAGAVAAERQRAICLSKNSGSLIFTRKDLSQHQQQQQQRTRNSGYAVSNNNGGSAAGQRQQPRSFRSAERGRKQQQQQQQQLLDPSQSHRYSLQLNYNNNNLISSSHSVSGFGKNHNNNNFCHAPRLPPPQQQQPPTATAAATRKQHAYSWYAPVYSALEEELEQDSRDSSPTHNLANTRKHLPHHYQPLRPSAQPDNETVALLEARNQINIQPQLHPQSQTQTSLHRSSRSHGQRGGGGGGGPVAATAAATAAQVPTSLPLPSLGGGPSSSELGVRDGDSGSGAQASSLGLAGGPLPRLRRWESFFKWVGIRPSSGRRAADDVNAATAAPTAPTESGAAPPCASPEITITRSPSDQNVVVLRHPAGRCPPPTRKRSPVAAGATAGAGAANDKLASSGGLGSSTSSLNFVHQKLWNMMRREGSASSLNHVKSHSIVQYTGMRKCETVLALTRQSSLCSPVLGAGPGIIGGAATQHRTGSGIFSASGVEQIRPLNRLRNSLSTMNAGATCSRCSSILSLAASESRYSLSVAPGGFVSTGAASLSPASSLSPSALASGTASPTSSQQQLQQQQQQMPQTTFAPSTSSRKSSAGAGSVGSSSISPPSNVTTATFTPSTPTSTSTLTTTPTAGLLDGFPPPPAPAPALAASRPARSTPRPASQQQRQPITVTSLLSMSSSESAASSNGSSSSSEEDAGPIVVATAPAPAPPPTPLASSSVAPVPASAGVSSASSCASLTAKSQRRQQKLQRSQQQQEQEDHQQQQPLDAACPPSPAQPFETFTCKLCLVDVEAADEATALLQCGCQFCTECMKAYVEFEISEGAYEISCPDAQCPAQGIVTLPEIASLTTANLMKKHHRYRLNREIELDKSRTWCPRAGCETVCLVGPGLASGSGTDPSAPSTSTALGLTAATPATSGSAARDGGDAIAPFLCAVQCPSCKDEFCSACKKAWHPNVSCEENGRRLVADGQDDIGIPFDNDLIKCCPMCAVPIEKDEGCAQMMCKRCKHVFCWYCLASLDDDFLLRHYDKGPCKNKLGHSRASVVWHRAQVIGIFAGFGILLLVASPLLLLAAPCIICCKCRICSGSKVDEGDGELDEATALQS